MVRKCAVLLGLVLLNCSVIPVAKAQPGINGGINTTPYGVKEDFKLMEPIGFRLIRIPLKWQQIERQQGQFYWRELDHIVETFEANRMDVLLTLRAISWWGTQDQSRQSLIYNSASLPNNMEHWKHFLETIASRYKGRGVHYEVENEVNADAFWTGSLDDYLTLLKMSYATIKQADPQAVILPSAMACGIVRNTQGIRQNLRALKRHDTWLHSILSTKAFDAVNVHNYYFPSEIVANGLTFSSYLGNIRNIMKLAGVADMPIWLTEVGYVSKTTSVGGRIDDGSPEKQARWLEEAYTQAPGLGVTTVLWLLLKDRDEPYFGSMGLSDTQGKSRPAWNVMRQLMMHD